MVLPFFFPAALILRFAGPEGAQNLAGEVLRLIQIRLATVKFGKNPGSSSRRNVRRCLIFIRYAKCAPVSVESESFAMQASSARTVRSFSEGLQ